MHGNCRMAEPPTVRAELNDPGGQSLLWTPGRVDMTEVRSLIRLVIFRSIEKVL